MREQVHFHPHSHARATARDLRGSVRDLLEQPHQQVRELAAKIGEAWVPIADLTHLPTRCRFIALMPQWDFLGFLQAHGRRYPEFELMMQATEATTGSVASSYRKAGSTSGRKGACRHCRARSPRRCHSCATAYRSWTTCRRSSS
jgi:hypothetical protein